MPVLSKEISLFPETLLDSPPASDLARCWWAIHSKPRQEKSIAREFLRDKVPFFLPQVTRQLIYGRRRIQSLSPLFSGYLFLFGTEEERARTLTSNRVLQLLPVMDQDELRRDLKQVHLLIKSSTSLTVEESLVPGRLVRIKRGALMGLEGQIMEHRNNHRLLVIVHFLNRGVSLDIDDIDVELLP